TSATQPIIEDFTGRAYVGEAISMKVWSQALDTLLLPFEAWIQPWWLRVERNNKYGNGADNVRMGMATRPNMPLYKDWAFVHYEYRLPSTWLVHPTLAYVYMALVKLCAMNWPLIQALTKDRAAEKR